MNANTQQVTLAGPAGKIECLVDGPVHNAVAGCVVISHPHPLFDGSMHNKVVQTMARAYVSCGWQAIRFNFRGVGASQGVYDNGEGECADLLAVITKLSHHKPLFLAGFSFGTVVTLRLLQQHSTTLAVAGLTLAGVAAKNFNLPDIPPQLVASCLVVHGEEDDIAPLSYTMDWARPQKIPLTILPGVGHFFHGNLVLLKQLIIKQIKAI